MKFRINPRKERNQELILQQEYRETLNPNHTVGSRKEQENHGSRAFMPILRTTKRLHNKLQLLIPPLSQLYPQAKTARPRITPKHKQMQA